LLQWSYPLLKTDGELLAWKGSSVGKEVAESDWAGWSPPRLWRHSSGLFLMQTVKQG